MGFCSGCGRYYSGNRIYCPKCGGPIIQGSNAKNKAKRLRPAFLVDMKITWRI